MAETIDKKSLTLRLKSGSDHDVVAEWTHKSHNMASGYDIVWQYYQKKWINGSTSTVTVDSAMVIVNTKKKFNVEYTAPDSATAVACKVRPVSKSHDVKDSKGNIKQEPYFKSVGWSAFKKHYFTEDKIAKPTVTVEMDGTYAKVTCHSDDVDCGYFNVKAKHGSKVVQNIKDRAATDGELVLHFKGTTKVTPGQTWTFFAQAKAKKGKTKSLSNWSDGVTAKSVPAKPTAKSAKALSDEGCAQFTWSAAAGADTYEAQYVADSKSYFDSNPSIVSSVSDITGTTFLPTNLEMGHRYYFRVRAVNDMGEGAWSDVLSTVLATRPEAPTLYETDPSYIIGDTVRLRWTHNAEDESDQREATVRVYSVTPNGTSSYHDYSVSGDSDHYDFSTSSLSDGYRVNWYVRTKGAHSSFSPWSEAMTFRVYQSPSINMTLSFPGSVAANDSDAPLENFPLYIDVSSSGGGGTPVSYHVSIVSDSSYDYIDKFGTELTVQAGETVFSNDYMTNLTSKRIEVSASDASLFNAVYYVAHASVSMASGLYASTLRRFFVDFGENQVGAPFATVSFDKEALTAYITPECYALDEDGEATDTLQPNVELEVYRINDDSTYTLLLDGIPNNGKTVVVDPHAQFNECWYRVVAISLDTGSLAYADDFDYSPHSTCVIQWGEAWVLPDDEDVDDPPDYAYAGTRIDGLYNLQFDESGNVESEDITFAGRKHPVAFYGTQLGYTARYQMEFPNYDGSTLALCRTLMAYRGDVYIREPSGTGFWAHTQCSLSRSYNSTAIRLSVNATRTDHEDSTIGGE